MNNILKHELRNNYASFIIWTTSAIVIMFIFALMFPTFESQANTFSDLLKTYPQAMIDTLGISLDTFNSPIGFYSFSCLYAMLILSIYAISVTLHIFSFDKTNKINEYLMSKPITRSKIFLMKLLASFILVNLAFILYYLATYITFNFISTSEISNYDLFLVNMTIYLCMLFFFGIGVIIANLLPKIKFVSVYAMGIVFLFYFITILYSILEVDAMKYLSPFSTFKVNDVLVNGFDLKIVIIEIIIIIILIVLSYFNFIKKEIK